MPPGGTHISPSSEKNQPAIMHLCFQPNGVDMFFVVCGYCAVCLCINLAEGSQIRSLHCLPSYIRGKAVQDVTPSSVHSIDTTACYIIAHIL